MRAHIRVLLPPSSSNNFHSIYRPLPPTNWMSTTTTNLLLLLQTGLLYRYTITTGVVVWMVAEVEEEQ
jgi:hypothetical protein